MIKPVEFSPWMISRERRSLVFILATLAGCLTGILAIVWVRQSSAFATAKGWMAGLVWWEIPAAALCWIIIRISLRSRYAWGVSFVVALGGLTWWVVATPSFTAVGDLLQRTTTISAAVAWGALLIAFMGLIDYFIGFPGTAKVVAIFWAFSWILIIVSLMTNNASNSKFFVWFMGVGLVVIGALIWTVVIETLLLLIQEMRKATV